MTKYIDTEKLKAEIEQLKGQLIRGACAAQIEMETNCKDEAYNKVLSLLDSFQQKQPETDLDCIGLGEIIETFDDQCGESVLQFRFTDLKDIVGTVDNSGGYRIGDKVKVYIKKYEPFKYCSKKEEKL